MGTIANLVVRITGDIAGLKAALSDASGSVQAAGEKMMGTGTALSLGVTAPIVGMAGAAIKAAAEQEQLQIAFETMLGSAERATALMDDINEFSAATPFQSMEVQESAKMLLAFGVGAEDVTDTLRRLGDISAGIGAPLKDMAYLFGTSRVQGRLFSADINQFTSRGVPIIAALAETMGVAQNEVKGLVEEGKVGFPELTAALGYMTDEGGQFAGLMAAQSQSMSGLFSTLKDNIELSAAAIGKTLVEQFDLKGKLESVLGWTDQLKTAVLDLAENNPELFRLGAILAGVAAAAGPALIGLGTAVKFAGTALGALVPVIGFVTSPIGLLIGVVALLGVAWANNWGGMRDILNGAWAAMQPSIEAMRTTIGLLLDYFTATFETGDEKSAFGFIRKLPEFLQAPTLKLGEFVAAVSRVFAAVSGGTTDFGALLGVFLYSGTAAETLSTAMSDLQIAMDWILNGEGAEVDWWWDITAAMEKLSGMDRGSLDWLADGLYDAGIAASGFITGAQDLAAQVVDILAPGIERVGESFGTLSETWTAILPNLAGVGEAFSGMGESVAGVVVAMQPLVELVGVSLVVAASFGINLFAAIIANLPAIVAPIIDQVAATITLISTTMTNVVALVSAVISGDWAAAWAAAQSIVAGFGAFFTSTLGRVKAFTTAIFSAIKTAVVNTLTDLGVDADAAMATIESWWAGAWEGLKTGMQPLLDGFAAVQGAIESVKVALEGFRDWVGSLSIPNPVAGIADSLAGIQGWNPFAGGGAGNNQLGTSYASGGWSWVGENRRPELVYLPRGAQVLPWQQAAAAPGGGVSVTINNANVRDERDLWGLAYRINDIAERRSR